MNIAAPNAATGALPSSTASVAPPAVGPDGEPIDTPTDGDGTSAPSFGALLSLSIDAVDETAAGAPIESESVGVARPAFRRATVPTSVDVDAGVAILGTKEARTEDVTPVENRDSAVAEDLASQLALVSQWAALAPVPVPKMPATATATSSDAIGSDPLDVAGRLDTGRAGIAGLPAAATVATTVLDAPPTAAALTSPEPLLAGARVTALASGGREARAAIDVTSLVAAGDAPAGIEAPSTPADLTSLIAVATRGGVATTTLGAEPIPRSIDAPVGTPRWSQDVAQVTLRIAASELQGATLQLNPAHLGPLDIQIRIDHGVAHLAFQAAHAETRQAIEASRASLEQLFAEQGLEIGDCAVGNSPSRGSASADAHDEAARRGGFAGRNAFGVGDGETVPVVVAPRPGRGLGMVDTFA